MAQMLQLGYGQRLQIHFIEESETPRVNDRQKYGRNTLSGQSTTANTTKIRVMCLLPPGPLSAPLRDGSGGGPGLMLGIRL